MAVFYSILDISSRLIETYESEDYSARHQAIKAAIVLASETQRTHIVRNDVNDFHWLIEPDGRVTPIGPLPEPRKD